MSLDFYKWVPVAEVGHFDYDWDGVFVYRNAESGRLAAVHESGCSCYGPGDEIDESDLVDITSLSDLEPLLAGLGEYERTTLTATKLLNFKNSVRALLA